MKYIGFCIHTNNVPGLVDFYSEVFGLTAEGNDVHAVIHEAGLAIWNPGNIDENTFSNSERYLTLMFEVDDAGTEYERLKNLTIPISFTSQPAEQPWGVKAFGIKDPDGNNINILSPIK